MRHQIAGHREEKVTAKCTYLLDARLFCAVAP